MFSSTTMESSTRIPIIRVIASSETVSSVKPATRIAASVTRNDAGTAIITTIALRHERRKKSITMAVKMMPSMRVRVTPESNCFVYVDCRLSTEKSI